MSCDFVPFFLIPSSVISVLVCSLEEQHRSWTVGRVLTIYQVMETLLISLEKENIVLVQTNIYGTVSFCTSFTVFTGRRGVRPH